MVEADQSSYGIYVAFMNDSDQAMDRTTPFKIDDWFYVNNKSGEKKNKFFYWDSARGFPLINKAIKDMATTVIKIGDTTTVAIKIGDTVIAANKFKEMVTAAKEKRKMDIDVIENKKKVLVNKKKSKENIF